MPSVIHAACCGAQRHQLRVGCCTRHSLKDRQQKASKLLPWSKHSFKLSSVNKFVFSPVERNFSESSDISSFIDCLSVADDNKNDKMFSLIDRKWIWIWISQNLWLWLTFYVKTFIQQQVNMLWNDCGESERNQTANQLDHHHNRQSFGKYLKIYGKMKFGEWIWGDYVDVLGMDSSGNYKARNDRESSGNQASRELRVGKFLSWHYSHINPSFQTI